MASLLFNKSWISPKLNIGELEQNGKYPLVICYIAMENGPVEIVAFPSYKMVDLTIVM